MNKNICIIGMGYIGLPTAVALANSGYSVTGVDVDEKIINKLNKGEVYINEPLLDSLVKVAVSNGKLKGTLEPKESDIFIICVQTPINKDKKPDMKYVINAIDSILPYIRKGNIVILESTSPVGTTDEIIKTKVESLGFESGKDVYIAYCPERVLPGNIMKEIYDNNRIIGGVDNNSALKVKEIYESFINGHIYIADSKTAEIVKLIENTYRDVNIAFANEVLKICENLNINAYEVIKYCNKHPRVEILNPGPGVGGHCLPVDPWFLVDQNENLATMIKVARSINDSMPNYVFNKIEEMTKELKEPKKIAILGISYKKNMGDIRESPILKLIDILKNNKYEVSAYDPYVLNCEIVESELDKCIKNSDVLLIGVEHSIFKYLNYKDILKNMKNKLILDTRNILDKKKMETIGFSYKLLVYDKD